MTISAEQNKVNHSLETKQKAMGIIIIIAKVLHLSLNNDTIQRSYYVDYYISLNKLVNWQ